MKKSVSQEASSIFPLLLSVCTVCLALAGCGSQPPPASETSQPAPQATQSNSASYDLRGKVVSIDQADKRVTVDNEEIPGFMSAMTMAYSVKDDAALTGLAPGDQITAKLVSENDSYWLEDITVEK